MYGNKLYIANAGDSISILVALGNYENDNKVK
jgi:hypothetical protein